MKSFIAVLAVSLIFVRSLAAEVRSGDIIFHTSQSSQSRALQLAMRSPYSHMGIIFFRNKKLYVFEASSTVRFTPFNEWVSRGVGRKYRVKRLKDESLLSPSSIQKLREAARKYAGKPYDLYFEWSDERIYCSELVWKMYDEALDIQIGRFQTFRDFDFSHPEVKAKLRERFGNDVPLSEKVISPAAMFQSVLLKEPN